MKKTFSTLLLSCAIVTFTTLSLAQATKIITLKDGSTLKGNVIGLKDGVYTLQTSNLGNVEIPESNVLSITPPQTHSGLSAGSTDANQAQKMQLKKQVEAIQGTILTDEGLMTEIQNMVNDEEIKSILSDPSLLNDVTSFDQNKIQENSNIQDLLKNPKMQDLMNKIQQKIQTQ